MKIEITIEVSEDRRSVTTIAKRVLSLEAQKLPNSIMGLAADVVGQTIAEAEDKEAVRNLPAPEPLPEFPRTVSEMPGQGL